MSDGSKTDGVEWHLKSALIANECIEIKVVKMLQELAESEPKAHSKHQRERRTNIT